MWHCPIPRAKLGKRLTSREWLSIHFTAHREPIMIWRWSNWGKKSGFLSMKRWLSLQLVFRNFWVMVINLRSGPSSQHAWLNLMTIFWRELRAGFWTLLGGEFWELEVTNNMPVGGDFMLWYLWFRFPEPQSDILQVAGLSGFNLKGCNKFYDGVPAKHLK